MYCPACGADAGDAKFCPECGTDLRPLAAPPDCAACGAEVPGDAKFCPECGAPRGDTDACPPRGARGEAARGSSAEHAGNEPAHTGRRTGTRGKSAGARQQRRQQSQAPQPAPGRDKAASAPRLAGRVSPLVAWGAIGAVAVVAILVIVFVVNGDDGPGPAASPGTGSSRPVAADTSGSYSGLVQRANGLYDQGSAKLQAKQYAQGAEYFLAASRVYAAAWKKQATDPAVGTDYATSLFYAGKVDAAVKQVSAVITQSPQFQTAWFNKGNYLAEKGSQADKAGNAKAARTAYAGAREAYRKAVSLDPSSASGQQAQQQLTQLPK